MGKFHLPAGHIVGLLCAAAFAFPAVVSAGTVSVDVSPTTGYTVTNRTTVALPPRTTSGPVTTYNPTLGPLTGGGAYQTTSSGVTITGVKGNAGSTTMSGRINAGASAMKNGALRCLTSMRCNAALMAGAAGIQALFNGIDYILDEGGRIQKVNPPSSGAVSCPAGKICFAQAYANGSCSASAAETCLSASKQKQNECNASARAPCYVYLRDDNTAYTVIASRGRTGAPPRPYSYWPLIGVIGTEPPSMQGYYVQDSSIPPVTGDTSPVPDSDIPSVFDNYTPHPSDLPYLNTGGLDFSAPDVNFEIMDIPSITGADSSIFIENSDGTSKGTNSEFDFSWSGPSKQPQVDVEETTTETTYGPSGEVIGTTTTTTSGSGSPANNEIEIPTDCDFMPTVCRFIDWFTEPDSEIDSDPDFTQLIDTIDIEREFQVGSSTAACPAPFQISLAWVPSVEVSLQPFCDLADLLRPFLLSLCFLYSGMIILRT